MKILVDTNFWLIPITCNVDIFSEFERISPNCKLLTFHRTLREIQLIPEDKHASKIALALIAKKGVEILQGNEDDVDDQIVAYASAHDVVVATQDTELKKRVTAAGRRIIFLRKKRYLEMN